jgi:SAM-dependent methyltransferase
MFYDFFAAKYRSGSMTKLGSWNMSRYHRKVCQALSTLQHADAVVLEIGPGIGRFAEECTAMNYVYVGVEVNQQLLRDLAIKYRMVCGLVPPLPVKGESLDVIVADQIIEHMATFREAIHLLSDCHRALKPSGVLVIGFPDYSRMTGLAFYDGDYSHSFLTTANRVAQILSDAGFVPVKVIRFSGSVSTPLLRLFCDLAMLIVCARITFLIGDALGVLEIVYRLRKTFVASTVILSRKTTS